MKKIAFTLCSNNYLAQAKTLGDSILQHHPEMSYIIGLIDKKHPDIDYDFFEPYQILPFDELGFDVFDAMLARYNIVEFNTAVKPFYFEYLANRMEDGDHIYYIDPDILIHQPMKEVSVALKTNDFVLTPHKLTAALEQGQFEKLILNVGVFNLGFLAIKISTQTKFFFCWWQERLKIDCRIAFAEGLFVDQIWANYIPCMFDKVYILKHVGYNMGYWNFDERVLSEKEGLLWVNEVKLITIFHYSSFDPTEPDKLCKWLKYSFAERPDLTLIYSHYAELLIQNNYKLFSQIPRGLNFRLNHPFADEKVKGLTTVSKSVDMPLKRKIGYALRNKINMYFKLK